MIYIELILIILKNTHLLIFQMLHFIAALKDVVVIYRCYAILEERSKP